MTYRAADRTLTDAEADEAHQRVVKALAAFSIQIR
jgi:phenylalanyl-tRNA synthetase beta subunit